MKKLKLLLFVISLSLLIFPIEILAQIQQKSTYKEQHLIKGISDALNGDSIPYFTLNIRVNIEKRNNKTIVKEITSNDPLTFKIFKRIKELKLMDYNDILKNDGKTVLVIPYIFFNDMIKQNSISDDEYIKSVQNAFAPYKIYTENHIINKPYERIIMFTPIIYIYKIIK